MSIINDALKKVQNNLTNKSADSNSISPGTTPPKKNPVTPHIQISASGSSPAPKPPIYPPRPAPLKSENPVAPVTPAAQKPAPPPPEPKKLQRFIPLAVALIILLLSSFALRHNIPAHNRPLPPAQSLSTPISVNTPTVTLPTPQPKPSVPLPASPAQKPAKEPVISGIMTMDNRQVALINNDIYEVGDMIGNMKIIAITFDQVDVEENGQTTSLKVHRKR